MQQGLFTSRGSLCAVFAVVLSGCGRPLETDYSGLNLVEVSGTVTLDGKPLEGATVLFEAEDQTYSYGRTNGSGGYELMFNSEQSGVIPGTKVVRITMSPVGEEADGGEDEEDPDAESANPAAAVTIPDRYNKRSQLTADVTPDNREFNFHLTSN